jgi:hypothetical protein
LEVPVPTGNQPTITARDVLMALSEIRRRHQWPLLQELEGAEPDLAEYVLEQISVVHHTLLKTGARPQTVRRLQRQVQELVLVCLLAPRQAGQSRDDTPPPAHNENS